VWGREELYWRLVQAGDVDNYRALWDDDFRGWPCKPQHTATKATITDWVRDIRDQKVKFSYSLTREGAADFGDIVVLYYKTPMVYEYPDGRVVDRDRVFKFTHTWRNTGKTWHIIGGMCGELPPQPSP
jgi:ketosteroid isomerase-like protein